MYIYIYIWKEGEKKTEKKVYGSFLRGIYRDKFLIVSIEDYRTGSRYSYTHVYR